MVKVAIGLLSGSTVCRQKLMTEHCCAEILEQSVGARNQVGIGLSYWLARLLLRIDSWAP